MKLNNPLFDTLLGCHENKTTAFLRMSNGDIITHKEFLLLVGSIANAISSLGISKGDRLVLQAEKSPYSLAIYAACVQSGIVFLPLNNAYTASEVSYFVNDSGAKILVCDPSYEKTLGFFEIEFDVLINTLDSIWFGSLGDLASRMPNRFDTVSCKIEDLAAILYTSGTSG